MTLPRWAVVVVGAFCGLTWAAGLRAYMAELAGPASTFGVYGTVVGVLLPGAVIGALDAWSLAGGGGLRWVRAAPLLFVVAPLTIPGALAALLTQGLGSGAVAVALTGIVGGFALGVVGPPWARIAAGAVAALGVAVATATAFFVGRPGGVDQAGRVVWLATLVTGLMVLFILASAIPWRRSHTPAIRPPT